MDSMTNYSSGVIVVVGNKCRELCEDAQGSIAAKATIDFCPDGRSALRLAGARARQIWFVAVELPDMSSFDCVDMLGQICPNAKFFLTADQYSPIEERQAVRLPRTRYVCDMAYREMIERITVASALAAQLPRVVHRNPSKPVSRPP